MKGSEEKSTPDVLDSAQLVRIKAVHRGFLYQHLYAVGCLLPAQKVSVDSNRWAGWGILSSTPYRSAFTFRLKPARNPSFPAMSGALARFAEMRNERCWAPPWSASFVIVANRAPVHTCRRWLRIRRFLRMSVLSGPSQPLSAIPHFPLPGTPWLMRPRGASRKQSSWSFRYCRQNPWSGSWPVWSSSLPPEVMPTDSMRFMPGIFLPCSNSSSFSYRTSCTADTLPATKRNPFCVGWADTHHLRLVRCR